MSCKNCGSKNIKLLKEGQWHTGYFCNECGTGRVDYYTDGCCANQNHKDIQFEQVNGVWIRRVVCFNCRTLIGGNKKKGDDFDTLKKYYQEKYKQDQEERSASYQTLNNYIRKLSEDFREQQKDKWWAWYSEYLNTPKWAAIRSRVLMRENGICQGCEISPAVHVHHTTYDNVGDELLFQLVALCVSCHSKLHPDKDLNNGY